MEKYIKPVMDVETFDNGAAISTFFPPVLPSHGLEGDQPANGYGTPTTC